MCHRICAIFLLFACACSPLVPAETPPQIQHTPGAFVTVSETRFDAGIFQLDYPSNWRVVKLSTSDTNYLKVAFVAPDQSTVTLTQVENADKSVVRLDNGVVIVVEINATVAVFASFFERAERLVKSIQM
ncbi:MAG: hypothetical protein OXG39_19285 [Chloroflexi bacterium]|nr:hypothetical protein [Chloroflexota bacterium]